MGTLYRDDWTEERIARLRQLHADRLSSAQIASAMNRAFGTSYSRSAICGKIARLGLSSEGAVRAPRAPRPRAQTRVSVPRVNHRRAELDAAQEPTLPVDDYQKPELAEVPVEQRKTLLQLTAHTCRWPVGDPGNDDFFFCGGEAASPSPYCAYHGRIAVQPNRYRNLSDEERARRRASARRRGLADSARLPQFPISE